MCTHLCHMRVHSRQLAAATRLAHVPRALSESLDTPTCLSKKLASAQRPAPRGPTAGTSSGRSRHAGGAHLAPRRAATPGAGATLWRPAGRASAQSPLPRPTAGTPSGHHRHAGSPAHAPRICALIGLAAGARIVQAPGLPPAPAPRRKGRPSPLKGVARAPAQRASVASKGRGVHATGACYACSFDS